MTLRDPEVIETLRDEPELLALADAFAETQRLPSRQWTQRPLTRALAVAGVAAAVALVFLLAPGGNGNHSIIDRALAAIGDERVLHLDVRIPTGEVVVDLKTGKRTAESIEFESWSDRSFARAHLVMRAHGQVADTLIPEDLKHGSQVGTIDPAFEAFWTGYRKALANGDAKLEQSGVVGGRPVYWLRFAPVRRGMEGTRVAIDQETYKPVLLRMQTEPGRGGYVDQRILTAETIPFDKADFKRLGPKLFGDDTTGSTAVTGTSARPSALRPPWLTAGTHVAGLTLSEVSTLSVTAGSRTFDGLELTYVAGKKRIVRIKELERPDDPVRWKRVSDGVVIVQRGQRRDPHGTYPTWSGELVKDGVYVTIESAPSESVVLEIARALQPA